MRQSLGHHLLLRCVPFPSPQLHFLTPPPIVAPSALRFPGTPKSLSTSRPSRTLAPHCYQCIVLENPRAQQFALLKCLGGWIDGLRVQRPRSVRPALQGQHPHGTRHPHEGSRAECVCDVSRPSRVPTDSAWSLETLPPYTFGGSVHLVTSPHRQPPDRAHVHRSAALTSPWQPMHPSCLSIQIIPKVRSFPHGNVTHADENTIQTSSEQ